MLGKKLIAVVLSKAYYGSPAGVLNGDCCQERNVDALGNPLRFTLTGGQRHEITQAEALLVGYKGEFVIADKLYDADGFRQAIRDSGAAPVIPPRTNRKESYDYDKHLYKERHLVECFIGKIKQ